VPSRDKQRPTDFFTQKRARLGELSLYVANRNSATKRADKIIFVSKIQKASLLKVRQAGKVQAY
jgi:hypothetical protein